MLSVGPEFIRTLFKVIYGFVAGPMGKVICPTRFRGLARTGPRGAPSRSITVTLSKQRQRKKKNVYC